MRSSLLAVLAASLSAPAWAGAAVIGSGNTVVIEPPVPHPAEAPCIVKLTNGAKFGANNVNFSYAPPAACPGPWAKVVLVVDVGLDAGIQYDRTGSLWLGGVNLWFGTTSEPTPQLAPKWHIEQDVTEDTALLLSAQTGFLQIVNYTNPTDNSVIRAGAELAFYPATTAYPAPRVPDIVIGIGTPNGPANLANSAATLSTTLNLPTNVASAELDLYTQSQQGDEFWYTCVPDSLSSPLESCGGGAFREGEVAIDGTPAGVAPVYPWIYTGGIDPYLWSPMPGVQTLNFKPFRVELTPFAGVLSSGSPHTLAVSVFGANNYFSVSGVFYAYLDHGSTSVTGAVTQNTLAAAPSPTTTTATGTVGNNAVTDIDTTSARDFRITGYAMTSAGKVTTSVHETSSFHNGQVFQLSDTLYEQKIKQDTKTLVDVTQGIGQNITETSTQYAYPLTVSYVSPTAANGDFSAVTSITQALQTNTVMSANGVLVSQTGLSNSISPTDTLLFDSSGNFLGNKKQSSTETYSTTGPGTACYSRTLTAVANILTGDTTQTCK